MIFIFLCMISSLLAIYFCRYSIKLYYKRLSYAHIPGPRTDSLHLFYTGNLCEILYFIRKGKNFQDFISKWYIYIYV